MKMNPVRVQQLAFPLVLLTVATILLPLPTIYYGYLLEDYYYLRAYQLKEVVRTFYSHWEPSSVETKGYRPLHSLQYSLFHLLIGGDPIRNHLLHLLLLLIGIYLLYALVLRCTGDPVSAFWTALIYPCLGTTAWQVSWLVNRQHLLLIIFWAACLICYDRYLFSGSKTSWAASFIFCLFALLLKEEAVTFPIVIFFFALVVRGKTPRSQLKPIFPFFLVLGLFFLARHLIVKSVPAFNLHPPPVQLTPGRLVHEYLRSLLATFIQSHGVWDSANADFPVYGTGITTLRDNVSFLAAAGFFGIGGSFLFSRGTASVKRSLLFGLAVCLTNTVVVSAWYRTNRLFLSSLGIAIMAGIIFSGVVQCLHQRAHWRRRLIGLGTLFLFLVYLAVNLITYWEIQWALRPDGYLALTWDKWLYQEYLPWLKDEQLQLFGNKLRRTGRVEWAESLPRAQDSWPDPEEWLKSLSGAQDTQACPKSSKVIEKK